MTVIAVETRIKVLLGVQMIALPLVTALDANCRWESLGRVILFSLVFSQAGLLGVWAASAATPRWLRLIGAVLWLIVLTISIPIAPVVETAAPWTDQLITLFLNGYLIFFSLEVSLPALTIAFVLKILYWSRRLMLSRYPPLPEGSQGLQFSIKHLMAATAIVAALIPIRQGLHNLGDEHQNWVEITIWWAVLVPCNVLIELASLWAALGQSSPLFRSVIVVPFALLLGAAPTFFSSHQPTWKDFVLWCGIAGLQALLTTATLLVFRSCGWRLCRSAANNRLAKFNDSGSSENCAPPIAVGG